MADRIIRVGTRGSLLARTQTEAVVEMLRENSSGVEFELVIIKTSGDVKTDQALSKLPGTGHFTKELEYALLADRIDLAVHSLKDLPTQLSDGLAVGAVPRREDPRDALVGKALSPTSSLTIGTSSLRRVSQLRSAFPACSIVDLRGNLDTRIRKVKEGEIDCAVVAVAGLNRIGRANEATLIFDTRAIVPAPAQGALAVEIRADDELAEEVVRAIHCPGTAACVTAERAFLQRLGGGCQVPVGSLAAVEGETISVTGRVAALDGSRILDGTRGGSPADAEKIGFELADDLIEDGASSIIEEIMIGLGRKDSDG